MAVVQDDELTPPNQDVRSSLLRSGSTNPAIQRLQQRVLEGVDASQVITSYDRMHHRHSRS
ncbi:YhhA family cyclophane-containing RiPP [Bradyrhizobium genosp. A]|uniref:YhhA family cyclophane-containing RiPP n=1 Tax=Bradyrhizobium genosp. A TaxID=83626 RepID=UPI003CF2EF78